MGDSFYILRNKETDRVIDTLIEKYSLSPRYLDRKEQIFSGSMMLISRQKGYTFLRLLSNSTTLAIDVKCALQL